MRSVRNRTLSPDAFSHTPLVKKKKRFAGAVPRAFRNVGTIQSRARAYIERSPHGRTHSRGFDTFDASQGRLLTVRNWCAQAREAPIAPIGRPSQQKGGFAVLMKTFAFLLLDVFTWAGERNDSLSKK